MSCWTLDNGGIDRVPECECCGCPVYSDFHRLCGACRQIYEDSGMSLGWSEIPEVKLINPGDLRD